jgi:Mlc titration factor MtfA (ptsG expression regulator)
MFTWLKNRRRRGLLGQPFPPEWRSWLDRDMALYRLLPEPKQAKLQDLIKVFIAEKNWEGCGGLALRDEMKVTISAQACLMALGFEPNYYFDGVQSILVFPDAFVEPRQRQQGALIVEEDVELLGEMSTQGAIVLTWNEVLETSRDLSSRTNLVVHEFAHHLDAAYGQPGGLAAVGRTEHESWRAIIETEYERLVRQARRGRPTLLDPYGTLSKAEFFAVASESFFQQPHLLAQRHPELFGLLQGFYRQDPREWRWELKSAAREVIGKT